MTLSLKHNFTSLKTDGTDASVLRPSNWNAEHTLTCATNAILGRATAGNGAVEELPTSAAIIALLANTSIANLLAAMGVSPPTTGDARLTLKTTATAGWVMMNDSTIGDVLSGAGTAAAECVDLFTLLYNSNISDTFVGVYTSAGVVTSRSAQGTAANAWANHCRISLPRQLGRALVVAGAGNGLTARALGSYFGGGTLLARSDLPNVAPTFTGTAGTVNVSGSFNAPYISNNFNTGTAPNPCSYMGTTTYTVNSSGTFTPAGTVQSLNGGVTQTAFDATQASTAWNVMVKL